MKLTIYACSLCFQIRAHALKCLGLCMLLDLDFARQYLATIITPSQIDTANNKV